MHRWCLRKLFDNLGFLQSKPRPKGCQEPIPGNPASIFDLACDFPGKTFWPSGLGPQPNNRESLSRQELGPDPSLLPQLWPPIDGAFLSAKSFFGALRFPYVSLIASLFVPLVSCCSTLHRSFTSSLAELRGRHELPDCTFPSSYVGTPPTGRSSFSSSLHRFSHNVRSSLTSCSSSTTTWVDLLRYVISRYAPSSWPHYDLPILSLSIRLDWIGESLRRHSSTCVVRCRRLVHRRRGRTKWDLEGAGVGAPSLLKVPSPNCRPKMAGQPTGTSSHWVSSQYLPNHQKVFWWWGGTAMDSLIQPSPVHFPLEDLHNPKKFWDHQKSSHPPPSPSQKVFYMTPWVINFLRWWEREPIMHVHVIHIPCGIEDSPAPRMKIAGIGISFSCVIAWSRAHEKNLLDPNLIIPSSSKLFPWSCGSCKKLLIDDVKKGNMKMKWCKIKKSRNPRILLKLENLNLIRRQIPEKWTHGSPIYLQISRF